MSDTSSPWLSAWHDPLAALKTNSFCCSSADVNADGDHKLLICDGSKKIKVYRGTALSMEIDLLVYPVALCVIYSELASVCLIFLY